MSQEERRTRGRPRVLLRAVLAVAIVGGLAAGGWMVWTTIDSIGGAIESIDLDEDNTGYAPPPTEAPTTTSTTLPPRDLQVLVVTADGSPAGTGVGVRFVETAEEGTIVSTSIATTGPTGVVEWLDIEAASVEVAAITSCRTEDDGCLVSRDRAPAIVALGPGLTSVELVVDRFALNQTRTGILPGDEVWSSAITLTGSVVVPKGLTLVIAADTTVTLPAADDESYLETREPLEKPTGAAIWSDGLVIVEGTAAAPVVFAPDTPDGTWAGLFGTVDAAHFETVAGREIRIADLSRIVEASITAESITVGAGSRLGASRLDAESIAIGGGAEFDHNTVAAGSTTVGLSGARLHHNEFTGTGQPDCVRLEGLSGNEVRNNILLDCPLRAISRPDVQPVEGDRPPLTVENNTFVALTRQSHPAVAIENEFVAVRLLEPDPEQFDTVKVIFINNIVYGPRDTGVHLGARPLRIGSRFKNNAFFGIDEEPRYRFDPNNDYIYGGRFDRPNLFSLTGVSALDFAWRDRIGRNWSESARIFDVREDVQFVDPGVNFRLAPDSPAIDAGDINIRDADGTVSDLGAYGGPGGDDWE